MATKQVRTFLVEDHELVRTGLRMLIEAEADLCVIGEAADGVAALEAIETLRPDVAIVDLSMPRMNGVELSTKLRGLPNSPRILTLTANEDPAYLRQLFQIGIGGYLHKRSAADELIHAIRTVARGERFLTPSLVSQMLDQLTAPALPTADEASEALSEREQAVLRMIAEGLTNREIGERLDISIKTVETYKSRGMQKVHLRGRTDIVRYAVAQGWLKDRTP